MFKKDFISTNAKIVTTPNSIVDKKTAIRKNMDTRFNNPTISYSNQKNELGKKLDALRFFKNK